MVKKYEIIKIPSLHPGKDFFGVKNSWKTLEKSKNCKDFELSQLRMYVRPAALTDNRINRFSKHCEAY